MRGLSLFGSIGLAALLACLISEWVRRAELLAFTTQVSESVPPIPAVWSIILLGVVKASSCLGRKRIVLLYIFLTVTTAMLSTGAVRMFFPFLTAAQYFSESRPDYSGFLHWLQPPFFPVGNEVIRSFYEGSESETVPWGAWVLPLVLWFAFFMVFFWTAFCLLTLFRHQWHDNEKLSFPLARFGLAITGQSSQKGFYRNPLMWLGFLAASLFVLTNVLGDFNPSVPHLGRSWAVAFPERPWSGLSMGIVYLPTVFGLAWLAPSNVSLSVWFSYILARLENTMGWMLGSQTAGIPFEHYQAVGGYIGLFLLTVWVARGAIWEGMRKPQLRWAMRGALAGIIFLVAFAALSGLGVLAAIVLLGTVLAFALVYAKLRSEAGIPLLWAVPYYGHYDLARSILPSAIMSLQNLTLLAFFRFLTRGYVLALPAYQSEAMEMAASTGIPQRRVGSIVMLATVAGLILAGWMHLTSYYRYGCNVLETTNPSQGGDAISIPLETYDGLVSPVAERTSCFTWTGVGLASVLAMAALQKRVFRFPLHPMGFVLSMCCGGSIWGMFFLAWLMKTATLRIGGLRSYRALTPLMLGVVLGEFFAAGAWSFASMVTPEWAYKGVIFFR